MKNSFIDHSVVTEILNEVIESDIQISMDETPH